MKATLAIILIHLSSIHVAQVQYGLPPEERPPVGKVDPGMPPEPRPPVVSHPGQHSEEEESFDREYGLDKNKD